ncbi:MAG: HD-GYP domain-containing protein [Desulfovibrionaceae bacterium]|nr:HD-GYP domain-containing protein [Desulfovibrionaceae bacterium]
MSGARIPEYRVLVEHLCPGVFIRLERQNWFDHPFLFNSFKIRDQNQIEALRLLGIEEVICVPEKSDCLPNRRPAAETSAPPETEAAPPAEAAETPSSGPIDRLWEIKKERIRRLQLKKKRIFECEERYASSTRAIDAMTRELLRGKAHSLAQALELVEALSGRFLSDTESTIHLINVMSPEENIYSHALNVCVLSMILGNEAGLGERDMVALGMGALFHDIGEARIEKKVLRKRGALTKAEQALVRMHPQYGTEMLSGLSGFPERALRIVAEHHECCDGSGYPLGLKRPDIDPLARMAAIANAYDRHCNHPDPDQSLTPYLALSCMFTQQKAIFDKELLSLFIRCLGVYPPGTVVQLSDGAIGMVLSTNPQNQLKPSLVVYDPEIPRKEALVVDLVEEPDLKVEKSIRPSHLPREIFEYLNPRTRISYYLDPAQ